MKLYKKLTLSLAAALVAWAFPTAVFADDNGDPELPPVEEPASPWLTMVIMAQSEGNAEAEPIYLEIADSPRVDFTDGVAFISSGLVEMEVPAEALMEIRYSTSPISALDNVRLASDGARGIITPDGLLLSGLRGADHVSLHSLSGMSVLDFTADGAQPTMLVDIRSLVPGVYILTINNSSIKVVKR